MKKKWKKNTHTVHTAIWIGFPRWLWSMSMTRFFSAFVCVLMIVCSVSFVRERFFMLSLLLKIQNEKTVPRERARASAKNAKNVWKWKSFRFEFKIEWHQFFLFVELQQRQSNSAHFSFEWVSGQIRLTQIQIIANGRIIKWKQAM